MPSRTPARYLAPAALVAAAVAVYLVGFNGSDGGSESSTPATATGGRTSTSSKPAATTTTSGAKTYTVQAGDVLSSIADKTGVSVEELQQLNPNADAQSLRIGQTLKLQP